MSRFRALGSVDAWAFAWLWPKAARASVVSVGGAMSPIRRVNLQDPPARRRLACGGGDGSEAGSSSKQASKQERRAVGTRRRSNPQGASFTPADHARVPPNAGRAVGSRSAAISCSSRCGGVWLCPSPSCAPSSSIQGRSRGTYVWTVWSVCVVWNPLGVRRLLGFRNPSVVRRSTLG